MILTDLFESPEIHNQDRLDGVLARCIELIHEKNSANPKKYGRVAACIIDMKNRKVFGINSPGADGRRRHAERVAIDTYHKRYGKILPGAIIVTTLSPCNRDMLERYGPSCQDLLMQAGIEKVYSGYMDPSQHSEHPFTEEVTKNDDLWRQCKEFSDSFVHDDLTESQHNSMSADQVLDYVNRLHHDFDIEYSITDHPEWELKMIPLRQLHLDPDGEEQDPYNRVNWVDYDKVRDLVPRIGSVLKSSPIVVDSQGWIIDGNHRAAAAVEAGLDKIPAYVPVKSTVAEGRGVKQEIEEFLYSLSPDDVGVEEFPGYRIHYEGFTDDCKSSSDYQRNPNRVYKQVYQDFIDREGGRKPAKSGMVGDEEYPILYSVFKVPQSKTIDTAEKAYNIAYKKKQPWPRGSREEQLIRSDWQLSSLYDQYVLKQDMAENFADGKGPGRPGDSQRHGIPKKATMAELEKAAHAKGRKGQLARWQLNMRRGKKK